jgi:ADP-heptose:LPS heptosyltransferase
MRIAACNPDTLGDLMLRQPLYAALAAAGHELLLIVRPLTAPLAAQILPGVRLLTLPVDPYSPQLTDPQTDLRPLIDEVVAFAPELLLVAPFQWTPFEARLSAALPAEVRRVGLTGYGYRGDWHTGREHDAPLKFDVAAPASEELPELAKNERLAQAVLGAGVSLPEPRLTATMAQRTAARALLERSGLGGQVYWAACIGDSQYTRVRNWRPEHWAALLRDWSQRHGRAFVLVGNATEHSANQSIYAQLGPAQARTLVAPPDLSLDLLIGLLAESTGYVGRDTGPMHLAAALGKPVLAVFGGGTWPRFVPAATPSCTLTVGVPCAGCKWHCVFEESWCIKDVPLADVQVAADELEHGRIRGREVRVLPLAAPRAARMLQEATRAARDGARAAVRLQQLSGPGGELTRAEAARAELESALRDARTELSAARARMLVLERAALHAADEQQRELLRLEAAWRERLATLRARLLTAESSLNDAHVALAQIRAERDLAVRDAQRKANENMPLRRRIAELEAQLGQESGPDLGWTDVAPSGSTGDAELKRAVARIETLQHEVNEYRQRVLDLQKSRWRKLGLKIGIARRAAWEERNGRDPSQ